MSLEKEMFQRFCVNENALKEFGFTEENQCYHYTRTLDQGGLELRVSVNDVGYVRANVYDPTLGEEYTTFRLSDGSGGFSHKVRAEVEAILLHIRDACFTRQVFLSAQSNRILEWIQEELHDNPDFEWEKFPSYAAFRNKGNQKWYALLMNVDSRKIGLEMCEEIEIINVKLDKLVIENLLTQSSYYPAYHMNKKHWISIVLDDRLADEVIQGHILTSKHLTNT